MIGVAIYIGMALLMIGITIVGICFSAALTIMPYISGLIISFVLNVSTPLNGLIVPDHPFMNFGVILIIIELIIYALMHIKPIGKAVALFFSELMIGIISMFMLDAVHPDSIRYCIVITAIYLFGNFLFLTTNTNQYDSKQTNTAGIIISAILYTIIAYFVLAIPAELLWQRYIKATYPGMLNVFNMIYLVLRIVVCGKILIKNIMKLRNNNLLNKYHNLIFVN